MVSCRDHETIVKVVHQKNSHSLPLLLISSELVLQPSYWYFVFSDARCSCECKLSPCSLYSRSGSQSFMSSSSSNLYERMIMIY